MPLLGNYKKWTEEYLEKYGCDKEVQKWDEVLSELMEPLR